MAVHEIKIGSNNFTLAPQQVKPYTSSTNTIYPISFLSDLGTTNGLTARTVYTDTNNQLYYNPSTNTLTAGKLLCLHDGEANAGKGSGILISRGGVNDGTYDWQMWIDSGTLKFSYNNTSWYDVFSSNGKNLIMHSGSIITPANDNEGILPATNNYGQIGSETKKFYRMYASTFYGDLKGSATNATYINVTTASTNASYYVQFVNGTTGYRRSYTDTNLLYNPSSNTLTAGKFVGYLVSSMQSSWSECAHNGVAAVVNNGNGSGGAMVCLASMTANGGKITIGTIPTANSNFYFSYHKTGNTSTPDKQMIWNYQTNTLSVSGGFYESSDERLKDFQEDIEVNFSYLHNIPKKYYSWKDDATYTRHIGTSAQEVQKYYPELVNIDDDGYLTMNYDKLSVVALKAIDILHEEVTELKKENEELKERLARLEELILNN
jgi:hypothetical protein